jgi:hypothetical protein
MGYLAEFIQKMDWWNLFPANEILAEQPGDSVFNHWISVVKSSDDETIVAYIPEKCEVKLFNPKGIKYSAHWFNPVTNEYTDAQIKLRTLENYEKVDLDKGERMMITMEKNSNAIEFTHDFENDMLILLKKK